MVTDHDGLLFMRNLLTSWGSRLIILVTTFIVTPVLVHGLGKELYGLWSVGFTLTTYIGLLDGGMNGGLVRMISAARARDDTRAISAYTATALVFYSALSVVILVLVYLFRFPLTHVLGVPASLSEVGAEFLIEVTAVLVLTNLSGVFLSVLNGLEAVHVASIVTHALALVTSLGVALAVLLHAGILTLGACSVAAAALTLPVSVGLVRARFPLHLSPVLLSGYRLREVLRLGLGIQISSLASVVNSSVDKLVISSMLGLAAAGLYDLGARLVIIIATLCWLVANAAFPTATRLHREAPAQFVAFYLRAERYLWLTAFGLAGALLVVAPWLILVWLGPGYGEVVGVTQVLALATAGLATTNVSTVALWAALRTREVTIFSLWRVGMHLLLSVLLTAHFGIAGALGGALLSLTLPSVWLTIITHRRLGVSRSSWWSEASRPVGAAALAALPCLLLNRYSGFGAENREAALIPLLATTLIYGLLYLLLVLWLGVLREDLPLLRSGRDRLLQRVRAGSG